MRLIACLTTFALAAASLCGQARQERSAASGLEPAFRNLLQTQPAWIGYTVPAVAGRNQTCDWAQGVRAPGPVRLEPPEQVQILFRVAQKQVEKIRAFSADCELDTGGLPLYWLKDARPAESVALLSSFAAGEERLSGEAVTAIAQHADPSADQALDRFAAASQPERLREKAIFWLGASRGRHGFEEVRRIVHQDAGERIRERAIFALSVSREPESVPELIRLAREDPSARVRGQALFWLAQKAGKQAQQAITDAIANDPDTEVKKRAVFALHQMPRDEGVPLLIQVARTNRNPAVRKQAMFWLGQSNDPRAVSFFEEILK
ncbi:MAG TPA: HEAT repeat domain-containing protein [Bryobacteraceae bacterium]|nr:HEAT repeat domain-containing protein [Bryobacteraceae bacterium]